LLPPLVVRADPVPSEPGPGDVFNQGANCPIAWDVDPTGIWTTMNIELMSGSNTNMNHITTVATVDGTDPTTTTFSYPCPAVTPNAPIYFYQFTSPNSLNFTWTTRFTIADANGKSVAAANPTEPDGSAIPWGVGALVDPSLAKPAPAVGTNVTGSSSASGPATPSTLPVTTPLTTAAPVTSSSSSKSGAGTLAPIPSGTILPSTTNSNIETSSLAAAPSGSGSASGNAANGGVSVQSSALQLVLAVAAAAAGFAFVL